MISKQQKISLSNVAGSLKLCDNPKIKSVRDIEELIFYRIDILCFIVVLKNDTVYVDNIFHELQDYENKMNKSFRYSDGEQPFCL